VLAAHFSYNSLAFPIALLGLAAAGAKATLANSSYLSAELQHQLKDSGAGLVFVHPSLLPVLLQALKLLGVDAPQDLYKRVYILAYTTAEKKIDADMKIDQGYTRLETFLSEGKLEKEEMFPGAQAKETMMLCYSSGTTGLSKGVEVCHSLMPLILVIDAIMTDFRIADNS
jgi:acyl-CoA synthetase (AMP-forming)/AMP-acid ligase II